MVRRHFLWLVGGSSVAVACRTAHGDEVWPGPSNPISYVVNPPPPVGERLRLTDAEWRQRLTRAQFEVLRQRGTERAFSCAFLGDHTAGTFHCAGCGVPLFDWRTKFESGTGWPSFSAPIAGRVAEQVDHSHGMVRTEVHCARCEGHLGHVFDDGPPPTGRRYCINSVSVEFREATRPSRG